MEVRFDLLSSISLFGNSFIILFIFIIIIRIKRHPLANIVLIILLLLLSFLLLNPGILLYTNLYYYFPHFLRIPMICLPFIGPLFYIYSKLATQGNKIIGRTTILHFIPGLVFIIDNIPFLLQSGDYKIAFINKWMAGNIDFHDKLSEYTRFALLIIHLIVYLMVSLIYVNEYKRTVKKYYSSDRYDFSWLRSFIILFTVTFTMVVICFLTMVILNIRMEKVYRLLPLFITISIIYLAYHSIKQSDIHNVIILSGLNTSLKANYRISDEKIMEIVSRIEKTIKHEKIYTEPDLSLQHLALKLRITSNQLSYVLNNHYGENFFDFINKYRVEEAKNILGKSDSNNFNLLNIGMNVGFNSKTSFNENFRKITGMTPSEYRKRRSI